MKNDEDTKYEILLQQEIFFILHLIAWIEFHRYMSNESGGTKKEEEEWSAKCG